MNSIENLGCALSIQFRINKKGPKKNVQKSNVVSQPNAECIHYLLKISFMIWVICHSIEYNDIIEVLRRYTALKKKEISDIWGK